MTAQRTLTVQYCDDVRQEIGNKFSLMGCYAENMIIDRVPAFLPKLCVVAKLLTPADAQIRAATVKLYKDGALAAEMPIIASEDSGEAARTGWQVAIAVMTLTPFPIEAQCQLLASMELDDGERIDSIKFEIRPTEPMP
ncbi:MAG: hypothetical protein QM718_05685 [Steroidobacteraceae bacterium]